MSHIETYWNEPDLILCQTIDWSGFAITLSQKNGFSLVLELSLSKGFAEICDVGRGIVEELELASGGREGREGPFGGGGPNFGGGGPPFGSGEGFGNGDPTFGGGGLALGGAGGGFGFESGGG